MQYISYAKKRSINDTSNAQTESTPRNGGLGFVLASIVGFILLMAIQHQFSVGVIAFVVMGGFFALLGWIDDRSDLSSSLRLLIQFGFAIAILMVLGVMDYLYIPGQQFVYIGFFGWVMSVLWIAGMANIYNFMDGVDGIAGVQALFAAVGWMLLGWMFWNPFILGLGVMVGTTVLAFMFFNWSPAKVFMGDVGSLFLGYFFSTIPFLMAYIIGDESSGVFLWASVLLLWPFVFDGTFTLIRRVVKGENVLKAHRSHLYQRLNIAGWPHARISLLYGVLCAISCAGMVAYFQGSDQVQIIVKAVMIGMMFALVYFVGRVEASAEKES